MGRKSRIKKERSKNKKQKEPYLLEEICTKEGLKELAQGMIQELQDQQLKYEFSIS